jgi:RNA polymerase sigma-70 factor (ECF subfamily)
MGTDRGAAVYAGRLDRGELWLVILRQHVVCALSLGVGRTSDGETVALAGAIEDSVRARVNRTTSIPALSDDQELIAAAKAGDQGAYGQLLGRHQGVAFRAAYLITGSAAEAEDATQDACMKAWLALRRFRLEAPFRPWLVRIAINEARNRRRGAGRRAALVLRLGPESAVVGSAPSAETEALAGERRAGLASAVGRLRGDDQLVIAARYFVGLSEAETAIALGVRRGTVKSRLSRALGRLQAELEATG